MNVRGLVFVGTRTPHAERMSTFVRDVLGLEHGPGDDAHFFRLPDGSSLAVQHVDDGAGRTVGLLVDDVPSAAAELRSAGIDVGEVQQAPGMRYAHFRAPDGQLWELVERHA